MGLLTFALNVTLDGCCDHREMVANDEMHRYWTRVMDAAGAMHHVEGDLARAVKALKKATPRGLLVGSPKLSAALQRLDLVDEYRFVVHPVVAGHGPFLFSGLRPSLRLKFVAATRLKSGIVALHYRRR